MDTLKSVYYSRLWHVADVPFFTQDEGWNSGLEARLPFVAYFEFIPILSSYFSEPHATNTWCTARSYYRSWRNYWYPMHDSFYIQELSDYTSRSDRPTLTTDVSLIFSNTYTFLSNRYTQYSNYRFKQGISPETFDICPGDYTRAGVLNFAVRISFALILFIFSLFFYFAILRHARYYMSVLLASAGKTKVKAQVYRAAFNSANRPVFRPLENHSHGHSAAMRNAANAFAVGFFASVGKTVYSYQQSMSDQRHGLRGFREYYWTKDLQTSPKFNTPGVNDGVCFFDVDQYCDMPSFLSTNEQPVLISTFQPTTTGFASGDYSFTFDAQSNVVYTVSGGAVYIHKVWNYCTDSLTAIDTFLGIPYTSTTYLVDRFTPTPHHDIILLSPVARLGFLSTLVKWYMDYNVLKRYSLLRGTHNRLISQTKDGMIVSTSFPGHHVAANVSVQIDNTISTLALTTKSGLQRSAIQSLLPGNTSSEHAVENMQISTILHDYHTANSQKLTTAELLNVAISRLTSGLFNMKPPERTSPNVLETPKIRTYQTNTLDFDAKPSLEAYMLPILDGSFAPDKTVETEKRAIAKRITEVASTAEVTPFITDVVNEFLDHLFRGTSKLVPVDHEVVSLRQFRPSQQKLIDEGDVTAVPKRVLASFMKAESYGNVKDARIISTFNPKDKVNYSRFIYALSDWMKSLPFYAFSKVPSAVDECVYRTCSYGNTVSNTDFSRFDGTISPVGRFFERCLLFRAFDSGYHDELEELHKHQYNLPARCTLGSKYLQGTARGSGSPETSAFNSLYNMFATYLGQRMTPSHATQFIQPDEAWQNTYHGLFGGDDGLSPNCDPVSYTKACTLIGLSVKIAPIKRGDFGITFLGRIYSKDIWNGDLSNCADLPRQLAKLHATHPRPGVSPQQILVDKLSGFYLTDGNTPVLGPFAKAVHRINDGFLKPTEDETTWLSRTADEPVFNNPPREWYSDYLSQVLPDFNVYKFMRWLDTCSSLLDLLSPPCCIEKPEVVPMKDAVVFVDDQVFPPTTQPKLPKIDTTPATNNMNTRATNLASTIPLTGAKKPFPFKSGDITKKSSTTAYAARTASKPKGAPSSGAAKR